MLSIDHPCDAKERSQGKKAKAKQLVHLPIAELDTRAQLRQLYSGLDHEESLYTTFFLMHSSYPLLPLCYIRGTFFFYPLTSTPCPRWLFFITLPSTTTCITFDLSIRYLFVVKISLRYPLFLDTHYVHTANMPPYQQIIPTSETTTIKDLENIR